LLVRGRLGHSQRSPLWREKKKRKISRQSKTNSQGEAFRRGREHQAAGIRLQSFRELPFSKNRPGRKKKKSPGREQIRFRGRKKRVESAWRALSEKSRRSLGRRGEKKDQIFHEEVGETL